MYVCERVCVCVQYMLQLMCVCVCVVCECLILLPPLYTGYDEEAKPSVFSEVLRPRFSPNDIRPIQVCFSFFRLLLFHSLTHLLPPALTHFLPLFLTPSPSHSLTQVQIHVTISPTHIGATIILNRLRLIGLFDLLLLLKSFVFDSIPEDLNIGMMYSTYNSVQYF